MVGYDWCLKEVAERESKLKELAILYNFCDSWETTIQGLETQIVKRDEC